MQKQQPRIAADRFNGQPDTTSSRLLHGDLTREVLGAFYAVYNELRYGFLESVYQDALMVELRARGLSAEPEAPIVVRYKQHAVGHFRADILVEQRVVVELKACPSVGTTERHQLLNYLRGTGLEVGLLLHFGPRPSFARLIMSDELHRPRNAPRLSAAAPFRVDPRPRFSPNEPSDP